MYIDMMWKVSPPTPPLQCWSGCVRRRARIFRGPGSKLSLPTLNEGGRGATSNWGAYSFYSSQTHTQRHIHTSTYIHIHTYTYIHRHTHTNTSWPTPTRTRASIRRYPIFAERAIENTLPRVIECVAIASRKKTKDCLVSKRKSWPHQHWDRGERGDV